MKKNSCLIGIMVFIFVLSTNVVFSQSSLLSKKEKLEDFNKMYEVLKENYISFEINRRVNGIDWLGNYEKYKKAVLETKDDIEFFDVINNIINDLNHKGTYVLPFNQYERFVDYYTNIVQNNPYFEVWLDELTNENVKSRINYWMQISQNKDSLIVEKKEKTYNDTINTSNLIYKTTPDKKTAILRIKSFQMDFIQDDHDSLLTIFSSLNRYDNFIIDIQGNSVGAEPYWIHYLIPYISYKTHHADIYLAFRNSSLVKYFYFDIFTEASSTPPDLPCLPYEEINKWDVMFNKISLKIMPNPESVNYAGNIFLLVDDAVVSATESFAVFSKYTGFATVAGITTAGYGLGRTPIPFSLPNSGLIIFFQAFMGLNPDGSPNEETKTTPEIMLNGETPEERLKELIKIIEKV